MTIHAQQAALRHVLYTPIHGVIGFARILREVYERGGPSETCLDTVIDQCRSLIKTIDEMTAAGVEALLAPAAPHRAGCPCLPERLQVEADSLLKDVELFCEVVKEDENPDGGMDADQLLALAVEAVSNLERVLSAGDVLDVPLASFMGVAEMLRSAEHGVGAESSLGGTVLVVDDDNTTRDMVAHYLKERGFRVVSAASGEHGLKVMASVALDLVLLDIVMPGMNGFQVLEAIKKDSRHTDVPVVMLSAFNEVESVARCIELGADDYLAKPITPTLLMARIASSLEKKRLRDREKAYHAQLLQEQQRSHGLLLNILPEAVAERLHQGQRMIADHFESVTVLFCDVAGFTQYASSLDARELVRDLNKIFQAFDELVQECGVEKIKTIGDAYLAVGGLTEDSHDHAQRIGRLANGMLEAASAFRQSTETPWGVRIGIHSGPVTAGVIGKLKFSYDIWGDTVNVASRMESTGVVNAIQVSSSTYGLLKDDYCFEPRGQVEIKGKGSMQTWLLGRRHESGTATGRTAECSSGQGPAVYASPRAATGVQI